MTFSGKICLASASPRRKELLQQLGVSFVVDVSDIDETVETNESADAYVRRMAFEKANVIFLRRKEQKKRFLPVLGADTAVVVNGLILGKPENKTEALEMLMSLSGKTHDVLTAIVLILEDNKKLQALSISKVTFNTLDEQEVLNYIESGEADDKAGAYGIQGKAAAFISRLEGSYSAVVGLPLFELSELLKQLDVYKK